MLNHDIFRFPLHLGVLHGLAVAAGLALYVVSSHGLRQRRNPSAAIAWVVSLALIPYLALPLYLMFGTPSPDFGGSGLGSGEPFISAEIHVLRPMTTALVLPGSHALVMRRKCAMSPLSLGQGRALLLPMPQSRSAATTTSKLTRRQ